LEIRQVKNKPTMKYKVGDILESGEEILYVNKEFDIMKQQN
jgi:hypothetical protein